MSGKTAKLDRRKVVHVMSMTYTADGKVSIARIPKDRDTAMAMANDLFKAILTFFVGRAEAGKKPAGPSNVVTLNS